MAVVPGELLPGHAAIQAFWLDDQEDLHGPGRAGRGRGGASRLSRLEVRYGDPARQEYRDLWVLRFAAGGRVEDFEEWAYWPGKPYSAGAEAAGE